MFVQTIEKKTECISRLTFSSITKTFGSVLANDNISFVVESGGIHAIVGENGAGKSTLTKILCGYYQADAGSIELEGRRVTFKSAASARRLGIGMVHQQLALVPSLTGYENVLLGYGKLPFVLNRVALEKRVALKAKELGFDLDLSRPVSSLGIAERQKLEIFKLLWLDTRVLILDEPTSQLAPLEAEEILNLADNLARSGRIVILITHHINEVKRFAKHITVLRKGKVTASVAANSLTENELAALMVDFDGVSLDRAAGAGPGSSLLNLQQINTSASLKNRALKNICLDICSGEIIGVAGITGQGQAELARLIAGLLKPIKGSIAWDGKHVKSIACDLVGYIPGEQNDACATELTLAANCFLKEINQAGSHRFGFVKQSLVGKHALKIIEAFKIRPPLPDLPCTALSGGNLQRLIIGRELSTNSRIVVADNPSAGLDAGTALKISQELRKTADAGRAVVLISPDLEEMIAICDRIVVIFKGEIIGEQKAGEFNSQSLGLLMGGVTSMRGNDHLLATKHRAARVLAHE